MSHMLQGKDQKFLYLRLPTTLIDAIPFIKARRSVVKPELAGGNVVLAERLDALRSGDAARIAEWCDNGFDLADLCATFEDEVKLQPDSPMLRGIRGLTGDVAYVVIDAKYAEGAVTDMSKFKVYESIRACYKFKVQSESGEPDTILEVEQVENAVVLPYDGETVQITGDQFRAIDAPSLKRQDVLFDEDISLSEIVRDGKVIHPVWGMYSPAEMVVELTKETLARVGCRAMHFLAPPKTPGTGNLYNLYLGSFEDRSSSHLKTDMSWLFVNNLGRREIGGETCQPLYVENQPAYSVSF